MSPYDSVLILLTLYLPCLLQKHHAYSYFISYTPVSWHLLFGILWVIEANDSFVPVL